MSLERQIANYALGKSAFFIAMPTPQKIDIVKELTDKLTKAKSVVFTDYRGLTHKQLEQLRRALKKVKGEFVVAKNSLIIRALQTTKLPKLNDKDIQGPTGTLLAYEDEVSPIREIAKMIKTLQLPKIKLGFLGATQLSESELIRFATLPNREQLIGQVVGGLKSPLYGLHAALSWNINKLVWSLSAIRDKKIK